MGISGLIPFLEQASTPINVRELSGCRVAVDSYCWLHRGVYTCAEKLIRGMDTDLYVQYCMRYVNMLLTHRIGVVMVFDGRHLPAKAETERRRRESRKEAKRLAQEHLRNNDIEKARSCMRRAIDVNHGMALKLMKACRQRGNVECVVAPYEADAQMAWLAKVGAVDYVITEDSDLTLFGTPRILFKLDLNGQALLVAADKLHLAMGCRNTVRKYTFEKFRRMCILSGCDYLDSLPGIGLKKACKFMLLTEEDDMRKALKKLPQYLKMRTLEVSDEYIEMFLKAEATFRHMYIYNPMERRMERLHALEEFSTEEKYCSNAGELMANQEQAYQLALGNLDPFTLQQVDNWDPDRDWCMNSKNGKSKQPPAKANNNNTNKTNCSVQFRIWSRNGDHHQVTVGDGKKESSQIGKKRIFQYDGIFRNIEYKHSTETEIQLQRNEEQQKLADVEVFSMYKHVAEQKQVTGHDDEDDEEDDCMEQQQDDEQEDVIMVKTPTKSQDRSKILPHNPFAKISSDPESNTTNKSPTSPICANKSLLKVLSPKKRMDMDRKSPQQSSRVVEVEVRSRFFAGNMRSGGGGGGKRPLATRDLSQEMAIVEDTIKKRRIQQQCLYQVNSPPTPPTKRSSRSSPKQIQFETKEASSKEDDDDDDCSVVEETTPTTPPKVNVQQFQNVMKRCVGLSKPTRNAAKKTTMEKNCSDGSSKQMTLAMFGFQKRPMLKNS